MPEDLTDVEKSKLEEKLRDAKNLPLGNELRLDANDFSEFTKDSLAIYPPFDRPQKFCYFLTSLRENVIRQEWEPIIALVKYEYTTEENTFLRTKVPTMLNRVTLDVYFTNQDEKRLSLEGRYGSYEMIREGVNRSFGNNWSINFDQNELGRALDPLLIGTNFIALETCDFPHSIKIPLKEILPSYNPPERTIEVYPNGVRRLSIELVTIDKAISVMDDWQKRHGNDEYFASEIPKRLSQLREWKREIPEPFLTYENVRPLPKEFQESLEIKFHIIWRQIEEYFRELGIKLRSDVRKWKSPFN